MKRLHLLFPLTLAFGIAGYSAEPSPDKSSFNLFNPTPASLLRELSTDRPDKTECPFTVDAGHLQLEMDWAVFSRDHESDNTIDTQVEAWSLAAVNIKVGLTNRSDFQCVIEPLLQVTTTDRVAQTTTTERVRGFGDITLRYKWNFWGNEGASSALAVMPFVKLPTAKTGLGNDSVEGGVILPYSRDLPNGWGLGVQLEVDIMRDEGGDDLHAEYVGSVTVGHDLTKDLGGYIEVFSQHSAEHGVPWVGTFDLGLTYAVSSNVQWDAGANLGLSDSAPDVEFFTGIALRF